ncbi:UNVERIFIED_ORG: type I restriction enzyme S subunit [Xanthobacter viscosus]|uniref:Restriction endonuclease subunit S n=1 Tax=Xanthobacter autotrophicus TaxID=280 RepID=A0A6C1KTQ1_XANAU|nr:restriction endonuclease subunit S [Xanthobacter autotrophicus]TLX43916.1 restriction endonuclease subunit S [Xanthobacter autotrophicus]
MSEHLPFGWSLKPLGDLAQVISGGTPSRNVPRFWEGGTIPWITPTDITATPGKYISEAKYRITKLGLLSCSASLLPPGSILMTSRATLGEAKISTMTSCTNQGFKSLVANKGVSNEFLYYQMQRTKQAYARYGSGSTFLEVGKKDTVAFPVLIPDEASQVAIAKVLALVDAQIEATEALIAKQERVRAGLMQDLFTRGVDEHGQLLPHRQEAPHLYHETELGWLPQGWKAPELESLLADIPTPMRSGPFGSALLKHELAAAGIPFLGIDNVHVEQFKPDFIRFVTPQKFAELYRYRVLPDDVVITIMGTVGRCCVIPHGYGEMLSSKHLWTMTFDQSKVLPELVCWQLNHAPWVLSRFRAKSQGGIMDAIQSSTLKELRLPLPPPPEQSKIVRIYREATSHLQAMRDEVSKLTLKKSGLMQVLLTGKVSVAPLLESIAA